MKHPHDLLGLTTEWRSLSYTWRDCALYALAVGAGQEELAYLYEKGNMTALPTFGVTPYWGAVNVTPQLPHPRSIPVLVEEALQPERSYVNLDYEFFAYAPIPPIQGTFVYRDQLTGLFDRGEGRGMAVQSEVKVYDQGGKPLCLNRCTTLFPTLGGYGGEPFPKRPSLIPDREADVVLQDRVGPNQHLLYRLTGDTNLVHIDPAVATGRGLEKPFVHDLCAFGYVCRLAIQALCPGQPEKISRLYAAMRSVLYPDTPVSLHLWRLGEGKGAFRLVNDATGQGILDRGEIDWQE